MNGIMWQLRQVRWHCWVIVVMEMRSKRGHVRTYSRTQLTSRCYTVARWKYKMSWAAIRSSITYLLMCVRGDDEVSTTRGTE